MYQNQENAGQGQSQVDLLCAALHLTQEGKELLKGLFLNSYLR